MRKLKCHTLELNKLVFAKVTSKKQKKRLRPDYVLLANNKRLGSLEGYQAIIIDEDRAKVYEKKLKGLPLIIISSGLDELNENDVVKMSPEEKELLVLYESQTPHNGLFLTSACNSRCIICPQKPRPDIEDRVGINKRLIELIAPGPEYLTLSGGEPTLLGDQLINIIEECRKKLPQTKLMLLTNGRRLKDINFVDKLARASQGYLTVAIALYSDTSSGHDNIVSVSGAFEEALQGANNLALYGFEIEIRIVIMALNYTRLIQLADFIYRNLTYASHIALMGLELQELAKDNIERIWIDPCQYKFQLLEACHFLLRRGFHVSIYNHQLCTIPKTLWPLARKSISSWKNIYLPICENCQEQQNCGGFFTSALTKHSECISPIGA